MNDATSDPGKTRSEIIKLGLIPVLLLVLAAILFWPASEPKDSGNVPQLKTMPVNVTPETNQAPTTASSRLGQQWPALDLSQVIAVNPFAKSMPIKEMLGELPEEAPPTELAAVTTRVESTAAEAAEPSSPPSPLPSVTAEKPEREVIDVGTIATLEAIIESDRGRSALINSRIFHVGDLLNGEYRIIEISPTAVRVNWIERTENGESR